MNDDARFTPQALAEYLRRVHRTPDIAGVRITPLGGGRQGDKGYGYGIPLRIDYEVAGVPRRAVIESVRPGPFGHEHMADRAHQLLWAHDAFGRLPRHVRSLDVGAVRASGELVPLGNAEELFQLAEFVEGHEYADDLIALRGGADGGPRDRARCDALADYLADVHAVKRDEPGLYLRRVRELVGHGECIFGVADSYPDGGPVGLDALRDIELACVRWRWRLRGRAGRLCRVHGDFHPWNILFRGDGVGFSVLDRSRGEWGEAADDVVCLAMNYLFFSLQRSGRLDGGLRELWLRFWHRYLSRTADAALLDVAAPFIAFRGLVMANPLWYPNLASAVRATLIRFVTRVLAAERFDPDRVDHFLT